VLRRENVLRPAKSRRTLRYCRLKHNWPNHRLFGSLLRCEAANFNLADEAVKVLSDSRQVRCVICLRISRNVTSQRTACRCNDLIIAQKLVYRDPNGDRLRSPKSVPLRCPLTFQLEVMNADNTTCHVSRRRTFSPKRGPVQDGTVERNISSRRYLWCNICVWFKWLLR